MFFQEFKINIENQYKANLPFVVYRKPNAKKVSALLQKDNDLFFSNDLSDSGFVFAPFDADQNIVLIPDHHSFSLETNFSEELKKISAAHIETGSINLTTKLNHFKLVEKSIQAINESDLNKVVLSRKEKVAGVGHRDGIEIYMRMLSSYPNAFVYLWYHPQIGMWAGATPEVLLTLAKSQIQTMSLAGTQSFKEGEITWKAKEKEEQQFVTDFISNALQDFSDIIQVSEPYTYRAGKIVHICSDISATLKENKKLKNLVLSLHPTPAVCGLPKKSAKDFILKNENYNRRFYTGFLGELKHNVDKTEAALFVNLRCMELNENSVNVYIGGGITKDSNPEKEWEETIKKSETMKSVLFYSS